MEVAHMEQGKHVEIETENQQNTGILH